MATVQVLNQSLALFSRAVENTFSTLIPNVGGAIVTTLAFALGLALTFSRRGVEGLRLDVQSFITTVTPFILISLVLLGWNLIAIPYRELQARRSAATTTASEVRQLRKELLDRRHSVDMTEPGLTNMLGVIRAFQNFAQARGPVPPGASPSILVSSADDTKDLAWQVTQWAVFARAGGNGDLQNIGVRPENLAAESTRGITTGHLLLHVPPQTPANPTLAHDVAV